MEGEHRLTKAEWESLLFECRHYAELFCSAFHKLADLTMGQDYADQHVLGWRDTALKIVASAERDALYEGKCNA